MSDPTDAPKQTQIPIDAVAGYFQKRMQAAENDCLLFASQVRELTNHVRQQADLIRQLSAKIDATVIEPASEPKLRRKSADL